MILDLILIGLVAVSLWGCFAGLVVPRHQAKDLISDREYWKAIAANRRIIAEQGTQQAELLIPIKENWTAPAEIIPRSLSLGCGCPGNPPRESIMVGDEPDEVGGFTTRIVGFMCTRCLKKL